MDHTPNTLELSRRKIIEDQKLVSSQEADIRGILLRGEPSRLAEDQLVDLNRALRAHIFERDLITAAIKLDRSWIVIEH